ncbi:hypothetical protein [Parvibaculum sp.]|uniref:hypothetical protein n=1 Tax=Parvibaculum sp. TaxID=2024848 RepID=UPI00349FE3E8
MTDDGNEARTRQEGMVTRYKVGVGEDFPLSDKKERARRFDHEHSHGEWRGGFHAPKLLVLLAVIAVGVALISTAASYPVTTLAVAAVALLFARDHFHGRRSFRDQGHRDRRDAA